VRKPGRDDLWDRTPGGVIVPRRPTLPTRRFIGKLGMAVDCCEEECEISQVCMYGLYWPGTLHATVSGVGNALCETCDELALSEDLPNGTCQRYSDSLLYECYMVEDWTCPSNFDRVRQAMQSLDGYLYQKVCTTYTAYMLQVNVIGWIDYLYCNGRGSTTNVRLAEISSDWFLLDSGETIQEAMASGGSAYELTLDNVVVITLLPPISTLCDFSAATATLTYAPP
jgi:hypothetical protein